MKFSVLLPTLNRLEYLQYAIETVRRQDEGDWEIIVSDNCSEEDIGAYVRSLADDRIRYVRTESRIPVTDNWNNALRHSRGDYIVMLGDDDGLLPGYFRKLRVAMEQFPDPDFVYSGALYFAYPGVMPDKPDGFLRADRNGMFPETSTFWLDPDRARSIARGYLDFRMPVASNMQFSLISRRKIDDFEEKGDFFQSPYPDFYATPALFLTSDRILIHPDPLVVIGITPKSYGYFHFNNLPVQGTDFLNNSVRLKEESDRNPIMLPGTSFNDSWLLAMQAFHRSFSHAWNMQPAYRRYRFLQIIHGYKHRYYDRALTGKNLQPLRDRMTMFERLVGMAMAAGFSALRMIPAGLRSKVIMLLRKSIGQHAFSEEAVSSARFDNLIDVFEGMAQKPISAGP
jgi:glycosyltransferase involved in cell wall biosynthesis